MSQSFATSIREAIQQSSRILLHLHPTPDGDSIGSALALWHVLRGWGKDATVLTGDSVVPEYLAHLPGAEQIDPHPYPHIDASPYDLFIIVDSAAKTQISRIKPVIFPPGMRTIVIDHHATNQGFGDINWIDPTAPATCQMIFSLLQAWNEPITHDIALCLFTGLFTDTGGFQYPPVSADTLDAAAALARVAPDFPAAIFPISNTSSAGRLRYQGLALSNIELHMNDQVAISVVTHSQLEAHGIVSDEADKSTIANQLKSVVGWEIGIGVVEIEPGTIKMSLRTRDPQRFHLGQIAARLGGGGHQAAAGLTLKMSIEEAKYQVLQAIAAHEAESLMHADSNQSHA